MLACVGCYSLLINYWIVCLFLVVCFCLLARFAGCGLLVTCVCFCVFVG